MTETHDFDRLARAWLDLMPDEAPDRVIDAVLQAVEAAPQARPPLRVAVRRSFQMNRFSYAAVAVAIVAILVGGAVMLSRFPATNVGGPTPLASASADASRAATELPATLQGYWFGTPRALPGLAPDAGTVLQISKGAIALSQSNNQQVRFLTTAASATQGGILVNNGSGPGDPCQSGQAGTYAYGLSASGQTLTITMVREDCPARAAVFDGTWWLIDCHITNSQTCLGQLDPGTYGSQYFASIGRPAQPWTARYGSLTFTVPSGWANDADWPNAFGLAPAGDYASAPPDTEPAEEIYLISNAVAESQATPCSGKPDAAVRPGAAAFIAWLRTIPDLAVGATTTVTLEGHPALSVDLTVPRAPTARCNGTDPVIEYLLSPGWPMAGRGTTNTQTHAIQVGNRDRLFLLDMPFGQLVAIVVTVADASHFDAFVQQATPIVQSLRFADAFPTP